MTNEEYHSDTSRIGKSGLDLVHKSPAHYYAEYLDPQRQRKKPTPAMEIGTAFHYAVLEPHKFEQKYFYLRDAKIMDEIGGKNPRATNRYKDWFQCIMSENAGKKALDADEYERIMRMRDAVYNHPTASLLFQSGVAETTVLFKESYTGASCKCRPDWLDYANDLIVDLKSAEDASPDGFGKSAYNHRYHVQSPFYLDGVLESNIQFAPSGFVFVAVEKEPPFAVGVYFADTNTLDLGRNEYIKDLEVYQNCVKTGNWHGYPTEISALRLPAWAKF